MPPSVVALHLNVGSRLPLVPVERARALAGCGLEGDRHARPGARKPVLIVEQEVLEHFGLAPGELREQITVRGLDLAALPEGTRLRAGGAVFALEGPCAPCYRMDELRDGLQSEIAGRRGRFASPAASGTVAVGDEVVVEAPPAAAG